MLGHFCDTKETMNKTIDFIKEMSQKYPVIELAMGYNTPFAASVSELYLAGAEINAEKTSELV
jgi:hypothetical protein